MQVVAATGVLISIDYGDGWARFFDNTLIGWTVDETGTAEPVPVVIGALPPAGAGPQWALFEDPVVLVPDQVRDTLSNFFDWMVTEFEVKLDARFAVSPALKNGFDQWALAHPTEVYTDG